MTNSIELKDFLPFATSLFGAFFGASGASLVGRFKEKRDEDKAFPDLWNTNRLVFDFIKANFKGRTAAQFVTTETQLK